MGNVIFQIKMIQINEVDIENDNQKYDLQSSNNTLLISGSANHSLILNKNYEYPNANSKMADNKRKLDKKSSKKQSIDPGKEKNQKKKENNNLIKNKNKICRICYQEEDDCLLNPLIRPCKCSGSMKYIHLKCLFHWLKSRTSNNQSSLIYNVNDNFNAYLINQKTECELCKQLFPDYLKHNDIKYCLIDFDYYQENKIKNNLNYCNNNNDNINNNNNIAQNYVNTNMENNNNNNDTNKNIEDKNNFMVLDTVFPLTDNNKYRYIVKFNKNNLLKIGRGLENQLVLNEITVSRNHSLLSIQKNKYGNYEIIIEDEGSKFGTLVLLQMNKIEIIKGKPLHIQISNIHIVIQYKKNNSLLSCCNVDVVDEKNSYEKFNYKAVKNRNVVNILTETSSDNDDNENNGTEKKTEKKNNKENINKRKSEPNNMILFLKNNNNSKREKENLKTIPKTTNNKNDNNEESKKDNDNNNESIEVDESNEKKEL